VLSFLVIGLFWVNHHRAFAVIERHDTTLVWLNLVLLLFITFIPYPTAILGEYASPDAVRLYAANLAAAGLAQTALWAYATWHHRLVAEQLSPRLAAYVTYRGLLSTLVFASSIAVSYVDEVAAMFWWGLILVGDALLDRAYDRETAATDE
jgi:uncharacterized membrane protein